MTHKDNGHFAAKHPKGTSISATIKEAVQKKIDHQGISCPTAHQIAEKLNVAPKEVGMAMDLQEARIRKCQLGLFGYGPQRKALKATEIVKTELQTAIESALVEGRLACAQAWRIADAMGIPRIAVANACEALKVKINQCQLGAF